MAAICSMASCVSVLYSLSMVSLLKFSSHEKVRSTIHLFGIGTNLSVRLSSREVKSRAMQVFPNIRTILTRQDSMPTDSNDEQNIFYVFSRGILLCSRMLG